MSGYLERRDVDMRSSTALSVSVTRSTAAKMVSHWVIHLVKAYSSNIALLGQIEGITNSTHTWFKLELQGPRLPYKLFRHQLKMKIPHTIYLGAGCLCTRFCGHNHFSSLV